ncbi:homocitrate synthase/isopropylmalate synthase family protein [Sporomusa acidovorans]|nr:hypothetical protein [Sporomusa acidovorans]
MNRPIWLDLTLDIAISRQVSGQKLAEIAGALTALGIRRVVVDCNAHQRCAEPDGLKNHIQRYGLIDLAEDLLLNAEQDNLKKVILVCAFPAQANMVEIETAIRETDKYADQVTLVLEGVEGMSPAELAGMLPVIKGWPVQAVIYRDKQGRENPFSLFDKISRLKNGLVCPVGIWAGNAFGLATANTLAAMKAGATWIMTAVGGMGGYAPWEEVLMAARQFLGIDSKLPDKLALGCQQLLGLLAWTVPANKAIIGPAIFAHESGLHVDGVTKDPEIYEPFVPEMVGLTRQLVVGKHSGTAALKTKFAAWGICLKEEESKRLLAGVRSMAVRKRTAISDAELKNLYLSG